MMQMVRETLADVQGLAPGEAAELDQLAAGLSLALDGDDGSTVLAVASAIARHAAAYADDAGLELAGKLGMVAARWLEPAIST